VLDSREADRAQDYAGEFDIRANHRPVWFRPAERRFLNVPDSDIHLLCHSKALKGYSPAHRAQPVFFRPLQHLQLVFAGNCRTRTGAA
jgi:hypothetical protein